MTLGFHIRNAVGAFWNRLLLGKDENLAVSVTGPDVGLIKGTNDHLVTVRVDLLSPMVASVRVRQNRIDRVGREEAFAATEGAVKKMLRKTFEEEVQRVVLPELRKAVRS